MCLSRLDLDLLQIIYKLSFMEDVVWKAEKAGRELRKEQGEPRRKLPASVTRLVLPRHLTRPLCMAVFKGTEHILFNSSTELVPDKC